MAVRHRKLHLFQREDDKTCLGCQGWFDTPEDRVTHAYCCLKKDTVNILECSTCKFIAPTYHSLRNHIGATHGPNAEGYKGSLPVLCHICSKEIPKNKMYAHLLRHTASDGRPFICTHCEKRFATRGAIKNHLIKVHFQSSASFFCHLCPMVFVEKHSYQNHLQAGHGIGKCETVSCDQCGKVLANAASLKSHMNSRHTDASEKPRFNCPHCDKFFFKKNNLETHIPTHFPEHERPHKCWCGRGFAGKDKLNRHQLEHTNPEKLLVHCTVCGKSMKSKQSLKVHMRIHTGKPLLGIK